MWVQKLTEALVAICVHLCTLEAEQGGNSVDDQPEV